MESERGPNADWTEEFSSIMFTMLQSAYQGSAAQIESNQRAELLATSFYEPYKTKQVSFSTQREDLPFCGSLTLYTESPQV